MTVKKGYKSSRWGNRDVLVLVLAVVIVIALRWWGHYRHQAGGSGAVIIVQY